VPTPTHDEVLRTVESVPYEDGVIVVDYATGKTLASRAPADPPIEHSAVLIAFNVPPLADSDPRSRTPSRPLAPPSDPAGGTQGATDEGAP
jgi:hypothetical protein